MNSATTQQQQPYNQVNLTPRGYHHDTLLPWMKTVTNFTVSGLLQRYKCFGLDSFVLLPNMDREVYLLNQQNKRAAQVINFLQDCYQKLEYDGLMAVQLQLKGTTGTGKEVCLLYHFDYLKSSLEMAKGHIRSSIQLISNPVHVLEKVFEFAGSHQCVEFTFRALDKDFQRFNSGSLDRKRRLSQTSSGSSSSQELVFTKRRFDGDWSGQQYN